MDYTLNNDWSACTNLTFALVSIINHSALAITTGRNTRHIVPAITTYEVNTLTAPAVIRHCTSGAF